LFYCVFYCLIVLKRKRNNKRVKRRLRNRGWKATAALPGCRGVVSDRRISQGIIRKRRKSKKGNRRNWFD
jgi:hypothetical protein